MHTNDNECASSPCHEIVAPTELEITPMIAGIEPERSVRPSPQKPRQVIAVSVSKGPSAFFNLARKFLVTDDVCDLSALEGAIVSAVDAAHLLERSKIATIVQIQTSYVPVEPKRRRDHGVADGVRKGDSGSFKTGTGATSVTTRSSSREIQTTDSSSLPPGSGGSLPGKPNSSPNNLRRARIVITVKRTKAYEEWLKDNPIQDTHAGQDDVNVHEPQEH